MIFRRGLLYKQQQLSEEKLSLFLTAFLKNKKEEIEAMKMLKSFYQDYLREVSLLTNVPQADISTRITQRAKEDTDQTPLFVVRD